MVDLYRNKNKKILDSIKFQNEIDLDTAELALRSLVKEKYFPAVKYFLDKKGENRGYGEVSEPADIEESAAITKAINRKFTGKNLNVKK